MAVIKGTEAAEKPLHDFDWFQSDDSRGAGWRYFLEATDLQSGMDPEKASQNSTSEARSCRKRLD
jgi:hypothetical protein